ncbi:MAG: ATP-binding cassette domain-containing protein [Flavobacteriales bacterium]|nr:ATP-binding cassette domain-containing protein [Flavobacteriales bacterium]
MNLNINTLRIGYDDKELAHIVDLSLQSGEIHYLIGRNGIGKSTLFKTLAGIVPSIGHTDIQWEGRELDLTLGRDLAHTVSYMHRYPVHSRITVLEFYQIALKQVEGMGIELRAKLDQAMALSKRLGIEGLHDRYIPSLSDGEYQKVLITLCLSRACPIILLDEPLNHLDPPAQEEMMVLFKEYAREHLLWMSTHFLEKIQSTKGRTLAISKENMMISVDNQILSDKVLVADLYR